MLPNRGEAALNRGFHLPNHCMNRFVGSIEERRNLIDTEQRIGVEREREKYLAAGEMLLVDGCSVGVDRLEITVSTPNTVGILPRDDTVIPAAGTGRVLPELLESPLDATRRRMSKNVLLVRSETEIAERPVVRQVGIESLFFDEVTDALFDRVVQLERVVEFLVPVVVPWHPWPVVVRL